MTAHETGGAPGWLDMSRFPDTDPDTVLSAADHGLLTQALAVDDAALPDAIWEHMLAVVVGDDGGPDGTADTDDPADLVADPADDPALLALDDPWAPEESADDAAHDPGLDEHHHWDGGAV